MGRTLLVAALLFIVGIVVGSFLAFWVATSGMTGEGAMSAMQAWPRLAFSFSWWVWSLGGGLVLSLSYLAWRLDQSS